MNGTIRISTAIFLTTIISMTCVAQEWLLHVKVTDSMTHSAIPGVHIRVGGTSSVAITDNDGRAMLRWEGPRTSTVRFTHVGHADQLIRLLGRVGSDTTLFRVRMVRQAVMLPEVTIGRAAPEVVFQRGDLHVGDYRVNADGLWVLVYEKPQLWHKQENAGEQLFRNARLYLLDTLFQEMISGDLPTRVRRLHADHRGRTIVEGERVAWLVSAETFGIVLHPIDRDTLHRAVLPWTDSIPGHLLGNNRSDMFPAFDHITWDPERRQPQVFCTVEDGHVMQLYRSQYKYMSGRDKVIAMDLAHETGIDAELIAGHMTGFRHDLYFRVPYAPLFVVDGVPCVFDHANGSIRRFTNALEPLEEVAMLYHQDRDWHGMLLQDAGTGTVHAVFQRNGRMWLSPVDASSGVRGTPKQLTHPWPEQVQVFGDHVYYVYRRHGSLQHRTLYRESLR